ncbi:MAG: CsbD-like [Thermoplasmata archaeon]|jgi:uncharacterized protein YjbJ (UPF0337 family)|nr:CsbD-like [Thermoplasmata archaeon]
MGEYLNKAVGKAKRSIGRATGDRSLERKGTIQQGKGRLQGGVRHAKNALEGIGKSRRSGSRPRPKA